MKCQNLLPNPTLQDAFRSSAMRGKVGIGKHASCIRMVAPGLLVKYSSYLMVRLVWGAALNKHGMCPHSDIMDRWYSDSQITHKPCLVTTLTVTRALCSRKQRGVTELSSPLCVLENSSLKRSTCPHEITDSLLVYLWQGQTHTLQIPVLCFINDYLNCLSPLINWNTRLVSKPWISCSPSSRPVDSGRPSAWACRRPLLRTGWPQGETVTHLLSCDATHSSHFHTVVLSGLVCSSLETKPLLPHAWKACRFSGQEVRPTVTAPLPSYNTPSPGPHSRPSK